jgi:diaminohydroxyphosphoribosylaminopyrimidine deaminase/5-amino-6-(5-phosphoribosylamino)uracil reductase
MMSRAVSLASKGEGRVEPNPMVGCVIAREDRVIGEGYHRRFGGPHAEVEALRACTENPRGATVYVSLEPCCHHGKTPPCSDALIEAGVVRVVIAVKDPSPHTDRGGVSRLRRAGIKVDIGVCAREAGELLTPFLTRVRLNRPYTIAKWAQSLDGKLATRSGDSKWISCEASRKRVHRLRGRVDAILVGSGTVLADDPMLTARNVSIRRRALRVVLDGRLRISEKCQLAVTASTVPTLALTSATRARSRRAQRLSRLGMEVLACHTRRGRLVLADCLRKLAERDVTNLLVEGGPTVLTAFLEAGLVDEAWVFVAPKLIGGERAPVVLAGRGAARMDAAITPKTVTTHRSGTDILYRMRLTDTPTGQEA